MSRRVDMYGRATAATGPDTYDAPDLTPGNAGGVDMQLAYQPPNASGSPAGPAETPAPLPGAGVPSVAAPASAAMAGLQSAAPAAASTPAAPGEAADPLSNILLSGPSPLRQDIGKRMASPLTSLASTGLQNAY